MIFEKNKSLFINTPKKIQLFASHFSCYLLQIKN